MTQDKEKGSFHYSDICRAYQALSISYLASECKTSLFEVHPCSTILTPYKMCLSNSFTLQNLQTGSVIQHNEGEKIEKHIYKQIDYVYCCNSNGNFYFETKMIL